MPYRPSSGARKPYLRADHFKGGESLDLQLRCRGCDTVVICGVATNMGVEGTARAAFDLNYHVVIAEDACGSVAPSLHEFAVERILPRISRVRPTDEILRAIQTS